MLTKMVKNGAPGARLMRLRRGCSGDATLYFGLWLTQVFYVFFLLKKKRPEEGRFWLSAMR